MATRAMRVGDTWTFDLTLRGADGKVANLTSATAQVALEDFYGTTVMPLADLDIDEDPTTGIVHYSGAGPAATHRGVFRARVPVAIPGEGTQTYPTLPDEMLVAIY